MNQQLLLVLHSVLTPLHYYSFALPYTTATVTTLQSSSTDSLLRASDISLLTLQPDRRLTTNSIDDTSHHSSSSSSSSSSGNSSDGAAGSSAENSTQPPSTQGLSVTGSDTEHEKSDLEHDTLLNLQVSVKIVTLFLVTVTH
jgi:hypothetical protein